jgi:hypothetical protein
MMSKMAPSRPTKRSKVADTRGSDSSVVVPNVASSPETKDSAPVNSNNNNNYNNTPPVVTANNIRGILLSLATSTTKVQAMKAMGMLANSMLRGTNAQEVFDLQGVSTIVYGILRYSNSEGMLMDGLAALALMTHTLLHDNVGEALKRLDFLDQIPSLASIHARSASSNAVLLLNNLSAKTENRETLLRLGSEGTVNFMVNMMTAYPYDEYVAQAACEYFENISHIPEVRERLLKLGVAALMVSTFQRFSNLDGVRGFKKKDLPRVTRLIQQSQRTLGRLIAI